MIKIKIIKADDHSLEKKILHLEKVKEGLWECKKTKLKIIDALEDLDIIVQMSIEHKCNDFWDMSIFFETETGLSFIHEVKLLEAF